MSTQDPNNTDPKTARETLDEIVSEEATLDPKADTSDEVTRLKDALARSQADYQNFVMRTERDKADMLHFLSAKMLMPLLTQVDNLERAVKLKAWTEGDTFVDGVRSVLSSMEKYLESQGVVAFTSVGAEVDPDRHDVMTEWPGETGKIVTEFEKGYMLRDRVLRHAKVVVGNGN